MTLGNLEVSYDWNGAYSGFLAVDSATPALANIGFLPAGITNYTGNSNTLEVAASGIDLTYAWYQNGVALTDGNSLVGSATPALTINPEEGTNSGNYTVVISNEAGSVTSAVVAVNIITTPTAPSFTLPGGLEPLSITNAEGSTVTFTAAAVGTGPISYQWYSNNASFPLSGATSPSLTLTAISTNQAGNYFVIATGGTGLMGTSSNAILTVTAPIYTNIAYLRSLVPVADWSLNGTSEVSPTLYTVQGVITTFTNLTSGNTASYYLQDSTGGINLFVTGDSTFRPALGDVVTATGVLSSYYENLEIDVVSGAEYQVYEIVTNAQTMMPETNALPTPTLLPWGYVAANTPLPVATNLQGTLVTMTNVYFAAGGGVFSSSTANYAISNAAGLTFDVFVSEQETNFDGQPIPSFASSVTGVLYVDAPNYAIIVTRYSDIVTNAPSAPVTITNLAGAITAGTNFTLTWTAVPNAASYSVLYSTDLSMAFTNKLASGLTFTNTLGTYTDILRTNSGNFYEVTSP